MKILHSITLGEVTNLSFTYIKSYIFSASKFLIVLVCLSVTLFQTILLFDNFSSKGTFRQISEEYLDGDVITPMVIFCSDPPQGEEDDDMIMIPNNIFLINIKRMKTMFKVNQRKFECFMTYFYREFAI